MTEICNMHQLKEMVIPFLCEFVICDMKFVICSNIFFPYFQIPFVVVSPGPVPRTRQTKAYMIESASETFFYKEDLRDIEKKGYGVVFSFNASNHYCPTIVISKSNYALWQLELLAMISMGSLSLIQEIDVTQLDDFQKVHLEVFKDQLNTTIQLFGPTTGATTCKNRGSNKSQWCLVYKCSWDYC